jgi:branched-subunit amino acid transport protein
VLLRDGTFDVAPASNPRAIAALIAILIAWKTKNVAAVIVAGMAVVWLFQALL